MYVCSFVLCLPIRIRNVPFPQRQAEAEKKKKETAAARELKAAKKAAEKAEAEAARAESAAVCVSNQYFLLLLYFQSEKRYFVSWSPSMYLFSQVVDKAKPKRDRVPAQQTLNTILKQSQSTPEKGDKPSKKKSPDKPPK